MLLAGELKIKGLVSEQVFNETAKAKTASSKEVDDEPVNKEASEDEKTPKAKKLKIKGLSSGKAFIEPSMVVQETIQENEESEDGTTLHESTAGYQVMEVESETIAFEEKVRVKKDTSHFIKEFVSDVSELEEKIETMMEKGEKGFVCKMCENYAGTRQHVIYHIEANHVEGLKHLCTECNRYYKVRNPFISIYANVWKSNILAGETQSAVSHQEEAQKRGNTHPPC